MQEQFYPIEILNYFNKSVKLFYKAVAFILLSP